MNLPRELHDLIYHGLWLENPCIWLPGSHWTQVSCFSTLKLTPSGLPLWLRTSKAVLEEGFAHLFTYAVWTMSRFPVDISKSTAANLVGTHIAANLAMTTGTQLPQPSDHVHFRQTIAPRLLSETAPLLTNPHLKIPVVNIGYGAMFLKGDASTFSLAVNLLQLNNLTARLDSFIIRYSVYCNAISASFVSALKMAYEAETRRVGLLFVGSDGTMKMAGKVRNQPAEDRP